MSRNITIDTFRGLAIVGMVFFTLTLKLSQDLPGPLRHNAPASVHLGDFVLPMFLFASGLSLAYFLKKRENQERREFIRDMMMRFGKLALIGILLSTFSAGELFGMDEVMLSTLLFLACVVLSNLDWRILLGVIFLINTSYLALISPGWVGIKGTDIFLGRYLGGYAAAPFYLPIMLVGLMLGKEIVVNGLRTKKNMMIIALISFFFLFSRAFVPINKRAVSPSFMMLSILFCFLVFVLAEKIVQSMHSFEELEYLGRKPFRYWIMMWVIFLIPLMLYVGISGLRFPLNLHWPLGVILSICVMLSLWLVSNFIDILMSKLARAEFTIK